MLLVGLGTIVNSKGRSPGGLYATSLALVFCVIIFAVFEILGQQRLQSDGLRQDASSMWLDASEEKRASYGTASDLYTLAYNNIQTFLHLGIVSLATMIVSILCSLALRASIRREQRRIDLQRTASG